MINFCIALRIPTKCHEWNYSSFGLLRFLINNVPTALWVTEGQRQLGGLFQGLVEPPGLFPGSRLFPGVKLMNGTTVQGLPASSVPTSLGHGCSWTQFSPHLGSIPGRRESRRASQVSREGNKNKGGLGTFLLPPWWWWKKEALLSEDECKPLAHSPGIATSKSRELLVSELCPLVSEVRNVSLRKQRGGVTPWGRCKQGWQVQLLSAGSMGIQDRLGRWKVLQPRQGMQLSTDSPEEEGRSSPSEIGDQPAPPPGLPSACISELPAFHGDVWPWSCARQEGLVQGPDVRPENSQTIRRPIKSARTQHFKLSAGFSCKLY